MSVLGPDTAESSVEMRRGESRTCPVHGRIHLCIGVHVNLCVWMRVLQHCAKWLRVYVCTGFRVHGAATSSYSLPPPPHPVSIAMRLHQIADVSSRYLSANSTSV